jgi:multicomponent K+:H+ antiporter subunit G
MTSTLPLWIEAVVAVLLVASGLASLIAATGMVRLPGLFLRLHAPAIAGTFGAWAVALASVVYFSALEGFPVLHTLAIPLLLAFTLPFTTVPAGPRRPVPQAPGWCEHAAAALARLNGSPSPGKASG